MAMTCTRIIALGAACKTQYSFHVVEKLEESESTEGGSVNGSQQRLLCAAARGVVLQLLWTPSSSCDAEGGRC